NSRIAEGEIDMEPDALIGVARRQTAASEVPDQFGQQGDLLFRLRAVVALREHVLRHQALAVLIEQPGQLRAFGFGDQGGVALRRRRLEGGNEIAREAHAGAYDESVPDLERGWAVVVPLMDRLARLVTVLRRHVAGGGDCDAVARLGPQLQRRRLLL